MDAIRYRPEFVKSISDYIEELTKKKEKPTVEGFAKSIGVTRNTVVLWATKKVKDKEGKETKQYARPEFFDAIRKLNRIEQGQEKPPKINKPKEGRPLKFTSVEELEKKIEAYFQSCWTQKLDMFGNPIFLKDANGKKTNKKVMMQSNPYTITGLAVFLDTDRHTLINYEAKDEFFHTIKRAKERCHSYAEEQLFVGRNAIGPIFNLKNNYGWKDETETKLDARIWKEEEPK